MKIFLAKIYEPLFGMITGSITWSIVGDAAFTLIIAFLSAIVAYWGKKLCIKKWGANDEK